jgi:osmotically inducible lipoprotein OsmB
MFSRTSLALLTLGAPLLLSACGTDPGDRALSGAGIGAATGAVVGAVTPLTPAGGALIGAAVGGATGALTTPSQVNLGKPVWRETSSASPPPYPATASSMDPATVRQVQAELQRHGYNVGPIDGRLGPRTQEAIREFEQRNGLPVDGMPSSSLLDYMQAHPTA